MFAAKTQVPPIMVEDTSDTSPAAEPVQNHQILRQIEALLEISNLVGSTRDLSDILHQIACQTAQVFEIPDCSIFLFDEDRENLVLKATVGLPREMVDSASWPMGTGMPGLAAINNRMITVADTEVDELYVPMDEFDRERFRSCISTPLRIHDEVIGAMVGRRYDVHEFTTEERTLFETIAKQVANVLEKVSIYYAMVEAERLAAISVSLSEIAHYIKNLLQGMKGGMYFVDLGLKRGQIDMARKGWEVLSRGNKKIASLVENMLSYSRERELNLQPHNINSLIYDILQQVDDSSVARGVAILPETYRDLPQVAIDYDRMHDSLLNIITNAIDAIAPDRDDGLVIVQSRLSEKGDFVEVIVKDNGTGMSPEVQGKIFNLFFSTKGERGSGIGLAVTRKVIEKHGGHITVESTEGQGSKFIIQIPVKPPASQSGNRP